MCQAYFEIRSPRAHPGDILQCLFGRRRFIYNDEKSAALHSGSLAANTPMAILMLQLVSAYRCYLVQRYCLRLDDRLIGSSNNRRDACGFHPACFMVGSTTF